MKRRRQIVVVDASTEGDDMIRDRVWGVGVLVLAAVFAAGCGGGPASGVPGPAVRSAAQHSAEELVANPCVLLTEDEVAQVLGAHVEGVSDPADDVYGFCRWELPTDPAAESTSLSFHFWPTGGEVYAEGVAQDAERVEVGDAAWWDPRLGITVVVGDHILTVYGQVARPGARSDLMSKDVLIAVARLAAPRAA